MHFLKLNENTCYCVKEINCSTTSIVYPVHCGSVLGPWTCWNARKWNRRQARKGRFCSAVCWTWAFLGGL